MRRISTEERLRPAEDVPNKFDAADRPVHSAIDRPAGVRRREGVLQGRPDKGREVGSRPERGLPK